MKKQIIIIFSIVIIFILLITGGYFYFIKACNPFLDSRPFWCLIAPYPDYLSFWSGFKARREKTMEFADWKTYRNEKYGFEIKYPEAAEVIEQKGLWENKYNYTDINFNISPNVYKILRILIREGVTPDYCKGLISWKEKIKINGIDFDYIPGFKWDYAMGKTFFASDYSTFKDNNCFQAFFRLSDTKNASEEDLNTEIFDQIISTFKFTK